MRNFPLVILAAGIGSRFGGLKQLYDISGEGESILDFSIYDALEAGFTSVVFIIRKEIDTLFRAKYENRFKKDIKVQFIHQETSKACEGFDVSSRIKPWGTGHALLMLKESISDPFLLINADDYYGKENFQLAFHLLKESRLNYESNFLIAYRLGNTLSKFGKVSRGICSLFDNNLLKEIIERTEIAKSDNGKSYYTHKGELVEISDDEKVSMNFWLFSPMILTHFDIAFREFLQEFHLSEEEEFFIPSVINELIKEKKIKVKVELASNSWYGITYKNDLEMAQNKVKEMRSKNTYPDKLF